MYFYHQKEAFLILELCRLESVDNVVEGSLVSLSMLYQGCPLGLLF
jgi:hypothetical protein